MTSPNLPPDSPLPWAPPPPSPPPLPLFFWPDKGICGGCLVPHLIAVAFAACALKYLLGLFLGPHSPGGACRLKHRVFAGGAIRTADARIVLKHRWLTKKTVRDARKFVYIPHYELGYSFEADSHGGVRQLSEKRLVNEEIFNNAGDAGSIRPVLYHERDPKFNNLTLVVDDYTMWWHFLWRMFKTSVFAAFFLLWGYGFAVAANYGIHDEPGSLTFANSTGNLIIFIVNSLLLLACLFVSKRKCPQALACCLCEWLCLSAHLNETTTTYDGPIAGARVPV
jgi:hypothetical protein